jgi:Fe2+ transport system protein FeoA
LAEAGPASALRLLDPPALPAFGRLLALKDVSAGTGVQIVALQLEAERRKILYAQGLTETRKGRVTHNDHRGRVLLDLGGELYLLGRAETARIQVRELLGDVNP